MDRISKSKLFRGLVLVLAVSISGFALAACGGGHHEKEGLVEGEPVKLGPLTYKVLFTRPLNIQDVEDSQYLVGKPEPKPDQMYIGVFLNIYNHGDEAATIPDSFEIETTAGRKYTNLPSKSIYALETGTTLEPKDNLPQIDSTAQVGPIGGAMLLYLIDRDSAENRPVRQIIEGEDGPASFDLDL